MASCVEGGYALFVSLAWERGGFGRLCPQYGCSARRTGYLHVKESFAPVRGGATEAERVALTEANDFCSQNGRQFVPTTMSQVPPTGYTVTFRCLLPTDPAVAQYHLQQAPNVIIEQRNR
jgi:hypothetical protein